MWKVWCFGMWLFVLLVAACKTDLKQPVSKPELISVSQSESLRTEVPARSEETGRVEGINLEEGSNDRLIWQKPDLVIELLGDLRNKTVADIGAGTGYFAFRMVPKAQKVIAIEIDPRLTAFMDSMKVQLSAAAQQRFETRLAPTDNPKLAAGEADVILIVDTYGFIKNRDRYLKHIKHGLKDGGQILIIDFKRENLPAEIAGSFTISLSKVVSELESAGFMIQRVDNTTLDHQYIIQAVK